MGLAKNATFYGMAAIAANIRKDRMFSMLLSRFVPNKNAANVLLPKNLSVVLMSHIAI